MDSERLTVTRTSPKDKMLRTLDDMLLAIDEMRRMVKRHVGVPTENAYLGGPQVPVASKRGKTRKNTTEQEVEILPEAEGSEVAENVAEAIQNVQPIEDFPELRAELKKITCPGGPTAYNTFRERLRDLFTKLGVKISYPRLQEIAGPLYKLMCSNPIIAGTGRGGSPGVPFDSVELDALKAAVEKAGGLIKLSPEIMDRIHFIANDMPDINYEPLVNVVPSEQFRRSELGITKKGETRRRTMKPIQPVAPANTSATTASFPLGKLVPAQLDKLQASMTASKNSVQAMRDRMSLLKTKYPASTPRANAYESAADKELEAIQALRNAIAERVAQPVESRENYDRLRNFIRNSQAKLATTQKQLKNMTVNLLKAESEYNKEKLLAPMTSTAAKAKGTTRKAEKKINSTLQTGAREANNISNILNATAAKAVKTKRAYTRKAKIQTPSGAIYQPGVNTSVGAVKPTNAFNPFNENFPANTTSTNAAPTNTNTGPNPFNTPPNTKSEANSGVSMLQTQNNAAANITNANTNVSANNNQNANVNISGSKIVTYNSANNSGKNLRLVTANVGGKKKKFYMDHKGVMYDINENYSNVSEDERAAYAQGVYNKTTNSITEI